MAGRRGRRATDTVAACPPAVVVQGPGEAAVGAFSTQGIPPSLGQVGPVLPPAGAGVFCGDLHLSDPSDHQHLLHRLQPPHPAEVHRAEQLRHAVPAGHLPGLGARDRPLRPGGRRAELRAPVCHRRGPHGKPPGAGPRPRHLLPARDPALGGRLHDLEGVLPGARPDQLRAGPGWHPVRGGPADAALHGADGAHHHRPVEDLRVLRRALPDGAVRHSRHLLRGGGNRRGERGAALPLRDLSPHEVHEPLHCHGELHRGHQGVRSLPGHHGRRPGARHVCHDALHL